MAEPTILIAGFSGRALAASARRAGFRPLVVDAFGDTDTVALADAVVALPEAWRKGFRYSSLSAALEQLSQQSSPPPLGLILATGFEDAPALVTRLAERYTLLGSSPDTIAATKSPLRFFATLRDLGIAHPQTRLDLPADASGWLTKRIGGSGGTHIARCRAHAALSRNRYIQREVAGTPLSMMAVAGAHGTAFAFAQAWTAPMQRRPFRFGGMAGSVDLDPDLEARMIEVGIDATCAFGLIGLASFDFLVTNDGTPLLLEINPRPGASLDILDDDHGTLFRAHLAASRGEDPVTVLQATWQPRPRAAAYFYADPGPLEIPPDPAWPDWVSDRPAPGSVIPRHAPVATVHATGANAADARTLLAERLGEITAMLYGLAKKRKEAP